MNLPRDLFAWLGIAPKFALEASELDRRQRELFVERQGEGPSVLESINEAVRLLKDPTVRAEQLFCLRGWPIKGSHDPVLLERIFSDREFIDLARKQGDIPALRAWVDATKPRQEALLDKLTQLLDGQTATDSDSDRALLVLEELRYSARAIAVAHAAIDVIEN